jgi:cytochrome c553
MRFGFAVIGFLFMGGMVSPAGAADLEAGKTLAATVCAACHGANGISVSDKIPNLAGQKGKYLVSQLKAFKSGKRKNAMMNAIAGQAGKDDIANVAAFFASLPGPAQGSAKSKPLDKLVSSRMQFPADFKTGFTHYTTINFAKRKQVRKYYANKAAVKAAENGKPLPEGSVLFVEVFKAKLDADKKPVKGADGFYVAEKLAAYTAMERRAGWGQDFPGILRNGDWHYAVFKADKSLKPNVNQATCLACHKPLADDSYVFSLKPLQAAARK